MEQKTNPSTQNPGPSTTHRGQMAELRALEYFEQKGYRLVVKNFRWKRGEADLIMMSTDNALVLIEVRSAAGPSQWLRSSVTPRKVWHLQQTLEYFVRKNSALSHFSRRIEFLWIEGEKLEHWSRPF